MSGTLHYRLRIRDEQDSTDLLVVSSVTGTNPLLSSDPPHGDGTKFDPLTGKVEVGEYVVTVADDTGTVTGETEIWREDFSDYANTAALLAVWGTEADPSNTATWTLDAQRALDGTHCMRVHRVGDTTAGQVYSLSRTLDAGDGIEASTSYQLRRTVYRTGAVGSALGYVWDTEETTVTSNASSELTVTMTHNPDDGTDTTFDKWFDQIRVVKLASISTRVVTGWLADEDGRWRALGCPAYLEESVDVGANWTPLLGAYVTGVELTGGIEYAITLGESDRRERQAEVFAREEGEFEATRLIGAPSGFASLPDSPYTHWVFEVEDTGSTSADLPDDAVALAFERGWMYEVTSGNDGVVEMQGEIANETREIVNRVAPAYAVQDGTLITLDGLIARVYADASGVPGSLVGEFGLYGVTGDGPTSVYATVGEGVELIMQDRRIVLQWDTAITALPAQGTVYHVVVVPEAISEDNPLHYVGHPVDFVRAMFDVRRIAYDASSADSVKAALGQMRVYYRFTAPAKVMEIAQSAVFAPFGCSVRPNGSGGWEFFLTRAVPSGAPSETLDEDTVHDHETLTFALDTGTMVNRILWKETRWVPYREVMGGEPPVDLIVGRTVTTVVRPDVSAEVEVGTRDLVFELPGQLVIKTSGSPKISGAEQWMIEAGSDILRRFERGCATATVKALRGHCDAAIGDYVVLDLGHRPNAETGRTPTAQRGGERIVQVVHRTETPAGPELEVLDYSANEATDGTVPTFTLALDAVDPRHQANATLTNSGALAGTLVRMEMGTGVAEPSGGVTVAVFTPDALPHDLFPDEAGTVLWVRMRTEPVDGGAPSDWSAWDDITLTALPAITNLVTAAVSDVERLITWTPGDVTLLTRVRWGLTALGAYTNSVTLGKGAIKYLITNLEAGEEYTVAVDHIDAPPFSGDGPDVTATWTNGGTTPTLPPPTNPQAFVSVKAQAFGIQVMPASDKAVVEVAGAVEDAVGAGTYGAFTTLGTAPVEGLGKPVLFTIGSTFDGLRWQMKARHTAPNWTPSPYTDVIVVDPFEDETPVDGSDGAVVLGEADPNFPNGEVLTAGDGISVTRAAGTITVDNDLAPLTLTTSGDESAAAPNSRQWENGDGTVVNIGTASKISIDLDDTYIEALVDTGVAASAMPWLIVTHDPYNATGDGTTDDTAAIQAALDDADGAATGDPRTVYFPDGIYRILDGLLVYSNTHVLLARNATILRDHTDVTTMLRSSGEAVAGGYGGDHDIVVEGGTWDGNRAEHAANCTLLGFAHCKNITIKDAVLTGCYGWHHIEYNAVQHGKVLNCEFSDHLEVGPSLGEAIQLDLMKSADQWGGYGPYDDTPCDDILIQGCRFHTNLTRGIGTHASSTDVRHTNIRIIGNHFEDCAAEVINILNWRDWLIEGNTFLDSDTGIKLETDDLTTAGDGAIVGNTFRGLTIVSATSCGILLEGQDGSLIENVTVADNTIEDVALHGIRLAYGKRCTITGNSINDCGTLASAVGRLIYLEECIRVAVVGNSCEESVDRGIGVLHSSDCAINGNTVRRGGSWGIALTGTRSVRNAVIGNVVSESQGNSGNGTGIIVADATAGHNVISGNTVYLCEQRGIHISSSAGHNSVTGNYVAENSQQTDNTYDGIHIAAGCDSNTVQMNTVRMVSASLRHRYGIRIEGATADTNMVTNNDLLTSGQTGSLSNLGTGTVTAAGNRL